jgi:hypothetical protein
MEVNQPNIVALACQWKHTAVFDGKKTITGCLDHQQ